MEKMGKAKNNSMSSFCKVLSGASAAISATVLGIASAFATTPGITLDGTVITGANNGLQDSAASLSSSVNNQYLVEFALMFIGFAVAVGVIMYFVKGHRRI